MPDIQPPPTPGKEDVTEALVARIWQRQAKGRETYGRSLESWNGRSALTDALDEVLDLAQYLEQELLERADLERERDMLIQENRDLREEIERLRKGALAECISIL